MEKINNVLKGILVILVFVFVCFLVYYFTVYRKNNTKSVDSVTDELKANVSSTIDKYLVNVFMEHSSKYCGQVDYDDIYDYDDGMMVYYRSKDYSSLDDVKRFYSSLVSDKYFNNYLSDKFLEKNGKLYCGLIPRGSLAYESGNVTVTNVSLNSDVLTVEGYYNTLETDLDASDTFKFNVSMVKSGNLWVIDTYEEIDN